MGGANTRRMRARKTCVLERKTKRDGTERCTANQRRLQERYNKYTCSQPRHERKDKKEKTRWQPNINSLLLLPGGSDAYPPNAPIKVVSVSLSLLSQTAPLQAYNRVINVDFISTSERLDSALVGAECMSKAASYFSWLNLLPLPF